jgi:Flp pilus assembly pilin Flp
MLRLYVQLKDRLARVRSDESGQDAFEYLLVIGVIMVAVVVAVAALFPSNGSGMVQTVVDGVEAAVTGVMGS